MTARPLAACILLFAVDASEAAGVGFPPLFTARYSVYSNGRELGEMTRSVSAVGAGAEFVFRSELKATRGLLALLRVRVVETSRWRLQGQSVLALEYEYRQSGFKTRKSQASFDWQQAIVRVVHKDQASAIEAPAGVLDKLLYQLVLMRDLGAGGSLRYTVVDGNTLKDYPIARLGEERIDTPIGTLETIKIQYQRPGKERRTTLWCAKSLGYLPVRLDHLEKAGDQTSAIIESVSGLGDR
ncbi:MAG: DUF3108 domain-containing protein [Chromatiales bacterium]